MKVFVAGASGNFDMRHIDARQLAARARRHVAQRRPRFGVSREQREQLAAARG
jgi:hypothetical protein